MDLSQLMSIVTYLAVLGNVALGTFLSALPSGVTPPWWVGPAAATINALVHALPSDGIPLPSKAVAKASALFLAIAFGLPFLLSACSPATVATVTDDISAGIAAACQDVANTAKLFPTSPVVVYAEAACPLGQAAATLVQNSATLEWLGEINAQLQQPAATAVSAAKP